MREISVDLIDRLLLMIEEKQESEEIHYGLSKSIEQLKEEGKMDSEYYELLKIKESK